MQMSASIRRKSAEIRDWPLVAWWIRITSPAPGSPRYGRNPQWREEVTSLLFPIVLLLVLLPIPTALNNPIQLITLCIVFCIDVGALFLKRAGMMHLAGAIITITIEFGLCSSVLATGLSDAVNLPLLDLLVQSSMVAMGFFPLLTVFFIAFLNSLFIVIVLNILPHGPEFSSQLAHNFLGIVFPSILLQIFVAGVSFIIIRTLIKEITRADNAEELAQLKQSEAELRKREAEQAQQLEDGIQSILQALNAIAGKGDFSIRVPLAQENILWRVGYSINNLLARLQGFRQEKVELDKTRTIAHQLTECVREGKHYPLNQWTGTSLDQLILEINKQLNSSRRPSDQSPPNAASHHYREV
jgi:hypothetical protein